MNSKQYRKVQAYSTPEASEGGLVADYLGDLVKDGKVLLFTHIAHGAKMHIGTVIKLKRQGWKAGFPDYVIATRTSVIFLELKKFKGGTVSHEQKEWLINLDGKNTYSLLCNGFEDAKEQLDDILNPCLTTPATLVLKSLKDE